MKPKQLPAPLLIIAALLLTSSAARPASGTNPAPASLKAAYGRWFPIGAAIEPNLSAAESQLLAAQFSNVTSENCLKPANTEPREGVFTFQKGDALIALAQKYGLTVNAHNLVWHEACPDWFFQDGDQPAGRALVLRRMRHHIDQVAGHFRGKVASWDVVNEAISDNNREYLRTNKWLQAVGEDYVAEAFLEARKADPGAELYYNDYQIERPAKRAKAMRLIQEIRARGGHVDGIGIQGHWTIKGPPLKDIEDSLIAFHAAGLKVMITELDLNVLPPLKKGTTASQAVDPYAQGCPPEILRREAEIYAQLFQLFRRQADKIGRVTFWNLHDGVSWLNWSHGQKRTNYPLLWDRQLRPKPAFDAVMAAAAEPNP